MTVVVLNIPCLWHHPIKPVTETAPTRSDSEPEAVPPLVGVEFVISAMAGVMCDHSPSRERETAKKEDAHRVHTYAHGEQSHDSAQVRPQHHLLEMGYIGISLLLLELVPECLNLLRKLLYIEGLDPLVLLL